MGYFSSTSFFGCVKCEVEKKHPNKQIVGWSTNEVGVLCTYILLVGGGGGKE